MNGSNPKVFISYSWQPETNRIKAEQLAKRLTADGVYVVVDFWDLKPGQDKNLFMEKMVNDESIDKVLVLCSKSYAEKANSRKGSVGIESSIISEEVFQHAEQTKFIPLILETDDNGKAFVPTYIKPRTYIDLSDDDIFEKGYDQLLRDIYDKPVLQRPALGQMPAYLNVQTPSFLPTNGKVAAIKRAVESNSQQVSVLIDKYLDAFLGALLDYRIDYRNLDTNNFIEVIETSIEEMQSLKNDFIAFLREIAKTTFCTPDVFIDFFEMMLQQYEDNDISLLHGENLHNLAYDNYRYFNYDLFVSFAAIMIEKDRYDILGAVTKYRFCIVDNHRLGQAESQTFMRFREYVSTLNRHKNDLQNLQRVSVTADVIKRNATQIKFSELVRADLLLYYLSLIFKAEESIFDRYWYPDLSIYNENIEVMPKLVSRRFFDKFKDLFTITRYQELKDIITQVEEPDIRDGYHRIPSIRQGLLLNKIGTMN